VAREQGEVLRVRAELALAVDPAERRPLLLRLLGWAVTDFDVEAARSYLTELDGDRELPTRSRALLALHKGALSVLSGKLSRAVPLFQRLRERKELPGFLRDEAARGLRLVDFEQLTPRTQDSSGGDGPAASSFWRFIDVLQASERGDAAALDALVESLEKADPGSSYLAAARALGRAARARHGQSPPPGALGRPRIASEAFGAALFEAREGVARAASQGAARLATACWILGLLEGHGGSPARGVAALLEAERLLHKDTYHSLSARAERAWLLIELGETDAAARLAAEVLDDAESRGAHLRSALAQATLAEVARRQKRPGEAESRAQRALDLLRSGELRGLLRRLGPTLALSTTVPVEMDAAPGPEPSSDEPAGASQRRDPRLEVPAPNDPRLEKALSRMRVILTDAAGDPSGRAAERIATELAAQALARYSGLSREYLTRRMRAELGLSLRELLVREQLAAALPRLALGEPADQVAVRVGFSDGRALRRALLRLTGRRLRDVR
jgi:AraC-like DNA-binding protein